MQLAMSKTIITKKIGASLAWDVSHSRPHRVKTDNEYDVLAGFRTAVFSIAREIERIPQRSNAAIFNGNAKHVID